MNPDQTAPKEQSDLSPYCLQYRQPMNISRHKEQTTKVVTGRLRAILSSRNHHSTVNGILDSYCWNRYYLSYDVTVIQWITSCHK